MEQYLRGGDVSLVLIGSSCWEIDEFENKIKKFDYPENHNDLKKNLINMKNHFPHLILLKPQFLKILMDIKYE